MINSEDVDRVRINDSIDDSVGSAQEFSNGRIAELGHDSTRLGKFAGTFGYLKDPPSNDTGVVLGVLADVVVDRLEVSFRSSRPEQRSHFTNCFRI